MFSGESAERRLLLARPIMGQWSPIEVWLFEFLLVA
jgi:hypothetical protein